jgi:hypothetical protein
MESTLIKHRYCRRGHASCAIICLPIPFLCFFNFSALSKLSIKLTAQLYSLLWCFFIYFLANLYTGGGSYSHLPVWLAGSGSGSIALEIFHFIGLKIYFDLWKLNISLFDQNLKKLSPLTRLIFFPYSLNIWRYLLYSSLTSGSTINGYGKNSTWYKIIRL